ncbi:glycosyltransferase [Paenilisteria rocourtiae]|uniref:Colanic acid/amylovoran biosynthesis glycosyltransferase n=2 Tax=Listeria rocourtiae TaxID=647910 RepID=A0A4R6ZPS6_9LIST|nr:glycosyltransferase [Listeria rocourtiae]MBC1604064.1 glycosyltransferase [Listeria rocourtiae]TDR54577.1 colanic acid/amylovoran biosynthesis glycosyltransferase [Listeria rocourtiae]
MCKKVLFFVTEFPTLSETFILNQMTGAIDLGHDVTILALKRGDTIHMHADVTLYSLLNKVVYVDLPDDKRKRVCQSIVCGIKAPIRTAKLLNRKKYGAIINSLQPVLVAQKVPKQDFDIVIAHYGNVGLVASILQDQDILRGKLLTFFHGYDVTRTIQQKGATFYTFLFLSDTVLLPISDFWAERLVHLGAKKEKVHVHHMGIDTNTFQMQSLKAIQPTLQLLLVARLTEKKGISDAIHAVRFLQNHGIDTVLHIVGDGENRLILEETVQRLELQKQVQFHGFLNQMQVKEHFNVSDIFILPSVIAKDGDMEGIPVSLMEAMAQGKPVISTIHSGIPELVIHGKTGFLVPERDAEALGRAIIDYLNLTDSQKAELIVNARQKVVAEFDINRLNNVLFQDGAW